MLKAQLDRHNAICPESPWVFFRQGSPDPKRKSARRGHQVRFIHTAWDKAVTATGITRLFHDLRRTGVRNLVRAGVPEKVAMMISGHKTRGIFDRYDIIDERDLHAAADKLFRHLTAKPNSTNLAQKPECA